MRGWPEPTTDPAVWLLAKYADEGKKIDENNPKTLCETIFQMDFSKAIRPRETSKRQQLPGVGSDLLKSHDKKRAMSLAVGGEFEALGLLEYHLLLDAGLKKADNVVDVGCGSGRLAVKLAPFLDGRYLGIDVVPELLAYAEELCQRPDWSFKPASGVTIPCRR